MQQNKGGMLITLGVWESADGHKHHLPRQKRELWKSRGGQDFCRETQIDMFKACEVYDAGRDGNNSSYSLDLL